MTNAIESGVVVTLRIESTCCSSPSSLTMIRSAWRNSSVWPSFSSLSGGHPVLQGALIADDAGTGDNCFQVLDNIVSGRVQNGKASWGGMEVAYPDYPHGESRDAKVYVRPHELDIERYAVSPQAIRITVERVNPTGSVAKIYGTSLDFGSAIHVELTPDRYAELNLQEGETVFVAPRRVRVFLPEYNI